MYGKYSTRGLLGVHSPVTFSKPGLMGSFGRLVMILRAAVA